MKGTDHKNPKTQPEPGHDVLADLFRQVPAREAPPEEDEQLIRQAVHAQWQEMVGRRRRKIWPWALAASILVAVVTVVRFIPQVPVSDSDLNVASIEKVIGTVAAHSASGPVVLSTDAVHDVMTGMTLRSGTASGAGLRWMNGSLIRLDENTDLKLLSADEIFLQSGRIYIDTPPGRKAGKPITIRTPQGLIRHLGTQFMTRWSASGLLISVREGEVMYQPLVDSPQGPTQAAVGQQLEILPNGEIERESISTWGIEWTWTEALSPGFQSDGRKLSDLFAWAGRELGRQLEYSTSSAESIASTTVLHGNLDLQPLQALSVATATSDLSARVSEGHIVITLSREP